MHTYDHTRTCTESVFQAKFTRKNHHQQSAAPPLNHNSSSSNHHRQAEAAQQPRHYLTIFDVSNNEILFFFFVPVVVVYVCVFQLLFSPLLFQILFTCFFFCWLKRHKRSTNRTVQRSTHEWIDSVASDSNTATNQFYISPPRKYSKYKLYTCTHIYTPVCVCVCYAYAARWEQQRWKLFAVVHMFVWECIYMYVCMCVCIGVVLSLTHIQFVAALPLPLLVFRRAFICRVVVCSFAAASTRHLAEIFRLRWFSIEREKKPKNDSYQSWKKNADVFFMLR